MVLYHQRQSSHLYSNIVLFVCDGLQVTDEAQYVGDGVRAGDQGPVHPDTC